MAVGRPAAAHSVNAEGLKRRGFTPEQIRNLRNAFRLLYRSGLKLTDATDQLAAIAREQPEVRAIVEFLPLSTRSIVR
jgi:UDP-N-acetylglucosamine acyltransferase